MFKKNANNFLPNKKLLKLKQSSEHSKEMNDLVPSRDVLPKISTHQSSKLTSLQNTVNKSSLKKRPSARDLHLGLKNFE
jgi:hypothetical protein